MKWRPRRAAQPAGAAGQPPRVPRAPILPGQRPPDGDDAAVANIVAHIAFTIAQLGEAGIMPRAVVLPAALFPKMRAFHHLPVILTGPGGTVEWGVVV